ncbi:hypothetical protein LTR91_021900 [Friedmanniomyces endolithicus]|uniref:PLD phosphodiesterase domain-containing protein n=1 Tax=Friedmanniomyces endolithicus TaxID=329885 RepID=A0AAN6H6L0_9PEZI|nr:hypothetical protein LTR35_003811 [Friedmanniomyces endolithicus]KAK0289963.1 hypothetical protein LTS00_009100 [Friedmanniomyces endolithicus]KAK0326064.1 hypothetical protein LTR82_002809 [Friedmanniomyces endolithicus]KAK0925494.1 hypothetical protein LTR57_004795 [Friedmanniomyces endolithicus]KAK0957348.1 hypothetical protein LTR91_021900 [Friedmanniomyces endolithicus]
MESDDEDLKVAIALSMAGSPSEEDPQRVKRKVAATINVASPSMPKVGLAVIDRHAMERDRLARLASRKRERSISPPSARNARKAPRLETTTVDLPSGARLNMFSTLVQQDQATRKSATANAANANLKVETKSVTIKEESATASSTLRQPELAYPHGVVKKTWAFGHERTGDDIKLEDVLEPHTLRTAVLSAFQWDPDWILSKLKIPPKGGSTKCVFIMQAKDDALKNQMLRETEHQRSFLRLCFPPMPGAVHCMHSKLMLLFHPTKLRIAIPTANLLAFDWGETGMMENSVFLLDLPRLPNDSQADKTTLPAFAQDLLFFLEQQTLDQDILSGILNFDFAATAHMRFVHTAGGTFFGGQAQRTGLLGLSRAVRDLDLPTAADLHLDFAASSIGSLNDDFLRSLHSAARGEDLIAIAEATSKQSKAQFFQPPAAKPTTKTTAATAAAASAAAVVGIRDLFRIYFPTRATVAASTAGAAGTICLSRKWYENMSFPRSVFRDYVSVRKGLLSHNKILYARGKQQRRQLTGEDLDGNGDGDGVGEVGRDVAWVYVGSANMSESAWGKLSFDKKAKGWKLGCRNWECGVLLPVSSEKLLEVRRAEGGAVQKVKREKVEGEDSETESDDDGERDGGERVGKGGHMVGMEVFDELVKPPFVYPGREYEGREPWYFQERMR